MATAAEGSPGARLRAALDARTVAGPGVYDAISARLVEQAGFSCAYVTGISLAASYGLPDIGLLTQTELVEACRRIAGAVDIPVIADADIGFGPPVNVARTIGLLEMVGVAAAQIEDQSLPKKPGILSGKNVITAEEMQEKIVAAVEARSDPNFVIIARTDALDGNGLEDALDRMQKYEQAGADVLYCPGVRTHSEIESCVAATSRPVMISSSESRATSIPLLTLDQYEKMGVSLVIYPKATVLAAGKAMENLLRDVREARTNAHVLDGIWTFQELDQNAAYDHWEAISDRARESVRQLTS